MCETRATFHWACLRDHKVALSVSSSKVPNLTSPANLDFGDEDQIQTSETYATQETLDACLGCLVNATHSSNPKFKKTITEALTKALCKTNNVDLTLKVSW